MNVYITPAGKTACIVKDFLAKPKQEFNFDIAYVLTSSALLNDVLKKTADHSCVVLDIQSPFWYSDCYEETVRNFVYSIFYYCGNNVENVVVNSSGGTEKISCIIKDIEMVLRHRYQNVQHVFGTHNKLTDELLFTRCPSINYELMCAEELLRSNNNSVEKLLQDEQ